MISKVDEMLQKITWDKKHVADFLGKYLSEPKVDVVFAPNKKISKVEFNKQLATKTLWLSLKSQLLFVHDNFYLNGEKLTVPGDIYKEIKYLADYNHLKTDALEANIHDACSDSLYDAYLAGYVCLKR
jgi:50S ribosomal protein L16 3-hydroxylase